MKKGWQTKKLGEMCEVVNGGTPKTSVPEYWDGQHRWITPAEMGKRLSPYVSDVRPSSNNDASRTISNPFAKKPNASPASTSGSTLRWRR